MSAEDRSPRDNPIAGDKLVNRSTALWGNYKTITVNKIMPAGVMVVETRVGGAIRRAHCTIEGWREWAKDATILIIARQR